MLSIHTLTITRDAIKNARQRRSIAVACHKACEQFHAADDAGTVTGKRSMARLGGFILSNIASDKAKVPFACLDDMLAWLNNAKQTSGNALRQVDDCKVAGVNFMEACTLEAWRKFHTDTIKAVDEFQSFWKAEKAAAKAA